MTESQPPPGGLSPPEALLEFCTRTIVGAYQLAQRAWEAAGVAEDMVPDPFFDQGHTLSPEQQRLRALLEECAAHRQTLENNLHTRLVTGAVVAWARSRMRFGSWVRIDPAAWSGMVLDVERAAAGVDLYEVVLCRGGAMDGAAPTPQFWTDLAHFLGGDGCPLCRLYEAAVLDGDYRVALAQCALWDEGWADTIRDYEWAPAGGMVRIGGHFEDIDRLASVSVLSFLGRGRIDPSGASPEAREAAQELLSIRGELFTALREGRFVARGCRGQRPAEAVPSEWWTRDDVAVSWRTGVLLVRRDGQWAVEYSDVRVALPGAEAAPVGVTPRDDIEAEMKARAHTQATLAARSQQRREFVIWAQERWPDLNKDTVERYVRDAIGSLPER